MRRHITTTPTPTAVRDLCTAAERDAAGNARGRGGIKTGQYYQDAVLVLYVVSGTKKGEAGYGAAICRLRHPTGNIRLLRDPSKQYIRVPR